MINSIQCTWPTIEPIASIVLVRGDPVDLYVQDHCVLLIEMTGSLTDRLGRDARNRTKTFADTILDHNSYNPPANTSSNCGCVT